MNAGSVAHHQRIGEARVNVRLIATALGRVVLKGLGLVGLVMLGATFAVLAGCGSNPKKSGPISDAPKISVVTKRTTVPVPKALTRKCPKVPGRKPSEVFDVAIKRGRCNDTLNGQVEAIEGIEGREAQRP